MLRICRVTGQSFEVTDLEMALRKKLAVDGEPDLHPIYRLMELGAFWWHWNLYKRKDDRTGSSIVSVFSEECPYPVWHREEWVKHASPPSADFVHGQGAFDQFWNLFHHCPIGHNMGTGSENCEYTDDWWYGKNCYLCHSGLKCEDLRYCYRVLNLKNCQFCSFCFDCERSIDLLNCHNCFSVRTAYNCWQCSDSDFLYDCRNCSHCFLCSNQRNKQYCLRNKQLTKEEYEREIVAWNLQSRQTYDRARQAFLEMLRTEAWHRALFVDRSEEVTGNYLDQCKHCESSFFFSGGFHDAVNCMRGHECRDCLDTVGPLMTELSYYTTSSQDHCYDVRLSVNLMQCKWMEYCMHCFQCEHCFACCGLVGKKYCILNKQYEPQAYESEKAKIVASMRSSGEYGRFFPGHFAPTPYDETISSFYWPLSKEQQERFGFRMRERPLARTATSLDASSVPDLANDAREDLTKHVFWDTVSMRPFQIQDADIAFAKEHSVPLPNSYYSRRLQENFRLIPFDGTLRVIACGKCGEETQTSWLEEYDGRILCEQCYLKEVY